MAFDFGFALIQATLNDAPFDLAAALSELEALYEDVRLGPSTGSIVDAAVQRNIPFRRMTEGSMVQFGWGSKQKRIQAAETSDTSAIAEAIAQDKELTKNLLAAAGVSVPIGEGDHLGLNYITSVEDLAVLKRVIVQNVAPTGAAVLNAADPMVAKMGDKCSGRVIFFAQNQQYPVITAHRAKNKKVIYFDGAYIVASKGSRVMYRFPVSEIPLTQNGVLGFQIENAMAAIGAAWALGWMLKKLRAVYTVLRVPRIRFLVASINFSTKVPRLLLTMVITQMPCAPSLTPLRR